MSSNRLDIRPAPGLMDTLDEQPLDPMLMVLHLLRSDPRPNKIDLGIGVYRDNTGCTPILQAVKSAERHLVETQTSKDYLSPEGDAGFVAALAPIVLGDGIGGETIWGMQTPGGTGALRLAAALLHRTNPECRVWIGTPGYVNHAMLMQAAGLEVVDHPFFDKPSQTLLFDAMMSALHEVRRGDAIVLQSGCHNPTGVEFSHDQWRDLAAFLNDRGVVPVIDMAYQGLGAGLDEDAWGLRHVLDHVPEALVCVSGSKNFGLYRDRVGALWVQGTNAGSVRRARTNLNLMARTLWSMPPDHGAAVVRTILDTPALAAQWRAELETMRLRIAGLRHDLATAVPEFETVKTQSGMFSLLPLDRDQVTWLRIEHGIYMVESGRINIAGLNEGNLPVFANALRSVL
ncbi:aromatic amino acid transaminase [Asticcacaulis sp. AC402]|uniref:amino acid aminotransferase n=1 Tax=Asticcacaulis sp. AC402 TaxID=1282361 RepID=UPI00068B9B7B|nr:aromatic amino acid transaminase [Asticcacaulis sp. AC402]